MADSISISITAPESITINGFSNGFAITPKAGYSTYFKPEPNNDYSFSTVAPEILNMTTSISSYDGVGSFDIAGALNVTLGTLPFSSLAAELDGFKYKFENFELNSAQYSQLTIGDFIFFKPSTNYNAYNTTVLKADTSNVNEGAYVGLFIFLGYSVNSKILYAMSKGYFDYEPTDSRVNNWTVGRTIYLNNSNKIDITPASLSNHWVKSLGLCIPNTDNKKRIWFDPDSTYLKIR